MNATVAVDIRDVLDLCDSFLDGREEAERLTKRLVGAVASDAREAFVNEGPGWAPRQEDAEQAQEHYVAAMDMARSRAVRQIDRKLFREYRRAQRKFSAQAAENRYEIWREFRRQTSPEGAWRSRATEEESEQVSNLLERTMKRFVRAAQKQEGKLLRSLGSANKRKVSGTSGEVRNQVPFSAAQNDGEVVGNGAKLPARTFLGRDGLLEKLDAVTDDWMSQLGAPK